MPGWAVIACYEDLASWLEIVSNNPDLADDPQLDPASYTTVATAYRAAANVIDPEIEYVSPSLNVWIPVNGGQGVKTDRGILEVLDA